MASAAPTKVLPLGDSITFGCGDGCMGLGCADQCSIDHPGCSAGYRKKLWHSLSPGSNTSDEWVFVGTQLNGPDDIDKHNEGHPGWKIADVLKIANKTWLPTNPDVIMLHLGTNDMGVGFEQAATATKHMGQMLDAIFDRLPKVRLLLSTLIGAPAGYGGKNHAEYNAGIVDFTKQFKAKGFDIELVDMATESGIGPACDEGHCCVGHVHPNADGYDLMADVWYKHLVKKQSNKREQAVVV